MSNTQLLYTQWNTDSNGNKISVLIQNEIHKIVNGQILLNQIPDEYNKVLITGMNEIKKSQSISSATQYKVDYNTGLVYFHPSKEGGTLEITQYYGRGLIFMDSSRIATDANGTVVVQTLKDLVISNQTAIADEMARVAAENARKANETARGTAETNRISNDIARGNAASIQLTNETARGTAETARATAESNRATAETARGTAETNRATAETARAAAETNRATSFASVKAAYDAAVASQSSVEVTAARTDGNTTVVYPDLQSRLNATELAPIIRESIPSGFTKIGTLDYTYMSTNPNTIKFADDWVAFVNGFKTVIPAGTVVMLDIPPVQSARDDLMFLEVWLDQTTGAPQKRIRTVPGVDFTTYPVDGFCKVFNANQLSADCGNIYGQGGQSTVSANAYDEFRPALSYLSNDASWTINIKDYGLYVAGSGDSGGKTRLKTLDGYVYAVPLFRIPRRPSCGFMETGEYDKISPLTLGTNQNRIIVKDRIAHIGDGTVGLRIDGRTIVNLLGTDGDCEDLSKLVKWGTHTLDSTLKLFGSNSIKTVVSNSDSGRGIDVSGLDSTHKYFVSAYGYISAFTSGFMRLRYTDYGAWTNSISIADFSTSTLNQWQRKSGIVTGKSSFRLVVLSDTGSTLTYNNDGIMIYDLTAIYGAGQEPSDIALLERQLPYVSGVGSASPVSVKSVGKNLFDKNTSYINYGSQTTTKNIDSSFTFTKPTTNGYTEFTCKVKPNTAYSASCNLDIVSGAGGRIELVNKSTTMFSSFGSGILKAENSISNNDGTIIVRFRSADVSLAGTAKIYNIQLEEGSVATTYEAYQESSVVTPAECNDMKSISSTVKDYTDLYARKQTKNISDWRNLTGDDSCGFLVNYIGYKAVSLQNVATNSISNSNSLTVIKNDNTQMTSIVAAGLNYVCLSSTANQVNMFIPNTDTGFSDSLTPTSAEIKSYFYGWKMCHSDGAFPYVPSLVPYTPATWAEWNKTGSVATDSTGTTLTANGTSAVQIHQTSTFKTSTKYGFLYNVISSTLTTTPFYITSSGTAFNSNLGTTTIGNNKAVVTSASTITANTVNFFVMNGIAGETIKIKDIRIFELPAGSQIETDFNTLTADQLAAKYLFYGLNPKNWKKVTDGTGQTSTLPTASYAGYNPYKMIYQLATPIETDLTDRIDGRLYTNNGTTNFIVDNVMTVEKTPVAKPNLVSNGDFSNGTTGWTTVNGCTVSASNNTLTLTGTGSVASPYAGNNTSSTWVTGKKIYASCMARVTNSACSAIDIEAALPIGSVANPVQNQWYKVSGVKTQTSETGSIAIFVRPFYADALTANGKVLEVQNVFFADLTAIFGAGNEPDQAWCDKYLEFGTNYLITGDVNTTALAVQRDNKDAFYGVNKQFAIIPASKYKTGLYELLYRPADGTVVLPDTTFTIGAQTLAMTSNTAVGSLVLADTDVGYKKNADGGKTYIVEPITFSPSLTQNNTKNIVVSANFYKAINIGDYLSSYVSNTKVLKVLSKDSGNSITVVSLVSSVGSDTFKILPTRPDGYFSDIIVQDDITNLLHQVSLTGFDNKQILNAEFDKVIRGEATNY